MVRAILEGRKTQTRRVMKPQPEFESWSATSGVLHYRGHRYDNAYDMPCPYGQPGDRLWVRETWGELGWHEGDVPIHVINDHQIIYRAEVSEFQWMGESESIEYRRDGFERSYWKPSIHMPRWASRITLEIVSVRPERLQEVTPRDAYAVGAIPSHDPIPVGLTWDETVGSVAVPAFKRLWDSINGKKHPWASNPWVWRIEFRRLP